MPTRTPSNSARTRGNDPSRDDDARIDIVCCRGDTMARFAKMWQLLFGKPLDPLDPRTRHA
ncbi:hypothetical protein, partial [Klebsiella aerogenes]|uniref:hypothetical protein n=1 Tax=Klebsiella aerogenes TaxID=548 RepID=UPI0019548786